MAQSIFEIAQEALRTARKHIDTIQNDLEQAQALNNRLQERLSYYEEMFGTYEDLQAHAVAPSEDLFDFTPEDVAELNEQDAAELTPDQIQAYYKQLNRHA